jgi:hypothetical protein
VGLEVCRIAMRAPMVEQSHDGFAQTRRRRQVFAIHRGHRGRIVRGHSYYAKRSEHFVHVPDYHEGSGFLPSNFISSSLGSFLFS